MIARKLPEILKSILALKAGFVNQGCYLVTHHFIFCILIFSKKALGEVIALGAGCFNQMSYLEILRRTKYAGISQINLVYKRKHRKQYYWITEGCRLYFMFKTKCRTNSQILKSLLKNRRKML